VNIFFVQNPNIYKQLLSLAENHETQFTTLEKERPDALEMAAQAN